MDDICLHHLYVSGRGLLPPVLLAVRASEINRADTGPLPRALWINGITEKKL